MDWKFLGIAGIVVVFVALAFGAGYMLRDARLTGQEIQEAQAEEHFKYSWTLALCGTENSCMDVRVECDGSEILSVTPISGIIQHTLDWQDPRGGNPELCPR